MENGIIYNESGSEVFIMEDPQGSHFLSELDSGIDLGSNVKMECNDTVQFSEIKKAAEVTTSAYHYGTLMSTSHLDQNYCLPLESCSSQLVEHSDIHFEGSEFLNIPVEEEPELDISDVEESKLDPPDNEKPELDISDVEESELDTPNNEKPELDISDVEKSELDTSHNEEPEFDIADVYREYKEEVMSDIHHAPGYSLSSTSGENALKIKVEADDITAVDFENIVKLEWDDTMANKCDAVEIKEFSEIKKECEAPPQLSGIDLGSNVKVKCNDTVLFSEIKKEPEGTTSGYDPGEGTSLQALKKEIGYFTKVCDSNAIFSNSQTEDFIFQPRTGKFTCSYCQFCAKTKPSLRAHIVSEHVSEKPFGRQICGQQFAESSAFFKHSKIHSGDKPYRCQECGKRFAKLCALTIHGRIHTGEKPYRCQECGKKFAQLYTLTLHKRIHTGEKPHECQECRKSFTRSWDLKRHKRIHTDEKPFECQECGKGFVENNDLKRHKRIHNDVKPYECQECGKGFVQNNDLKRHKRIHNDVKPYECQECGKCFSIHGSLIKHKRIHTGAKPYKCQECGKMFAWVKSLRTHKRLHTGEKPYECNECGQRFTQNSNLKRHKRIHTS